MICKCYSPLSVDFMPVARVSWEEGWVTCSCTRMPVYWYRHHNFRNRR